MSDSSEETGYVNVRLSVREGVGGTGRETQGVFVSVSTDELASLRSALSARVKELEEALEPFALASSEGVVKAQTGHVTITTCAEYFHRARTTLEQKP